MKLLIRFQSKSLSSEIGDYFTDLESPPSVSAVIQQRRKLDPEALYKVFRLFTQSIHARNLFRGYRLLASDGSDINIPYDSDDSDTYHIQKGMNRGFNQLHLNALFDVLNNCYTDIEIDTFFKSNEPSAAEEMLEKNADNYGKFIYIADRGYEKYQLLAFLTEKRMKYIIRVKDISSNGILSTMNLPDEEFDADLEKSLQDCRTNFSSAVTNIRQYLAGHIDEEKLILRIKKFLIPIRPGRSFARNIRSQSAKLFTYRSA